MPGFDELGITLIVVTGASRGLGASICEEMSRLLASGSVIVGLARTLSGLEETERKVKEANSNVQFVSKCFDAGIASSSVIQQILDEVHHIKRSFNRTLLIHNAGTLGDLGLLKDVGDSDNIKNFYDVNVSSVLPLTSLFLRFVRSNHPKAQIHVINISSLLAIEPFKTMGLYCSAKAARDMLFKTLAIEEEDVDVLNYAPGPLDNEMQDTVQNSSGIDPDLKKIFASMKEEGKLIQCSTSVSKLIIILQSGKYKSGDHVDIFDDLPSSGAT